MTGNESFDNFLDDWNNDKFDTFEDAFYQMLGMYEGFKTDVYDDGLGNLTVGIGFNISDETAQTRFEQALPGVDFNAVVNGDITLTPAQVAQLGHYTANEAQQTARNFIGADVYDNLPNEAKAIIGNMAMMGAPSLGGFQNFREAIRSGNYQAAANEMQNSRWYGQTGNRGRQLTGWMRTL